MKDNIFFDEAQPQGINPNAVGEINDLLEKANILDSRIKSLRSDRGEIPHYLLLETYSIIK